MNKVFEMMSTLSDFTSNLSMTDHVEPEITTQNNARSYKTLYDGRVELFFKSVRGLTGDQLIRMTTKSWNEDPLDTLKIMFQTRDCRSGKGERKLFMEFMTWLCVRSPRDLVTNLELIPEYGRWLDLVELAQNNEMEEIIWQVFAQRLLEDVKLMNEGKPISLCAKWVPTEGSKWDKQLKATHKIANVLEVNLKTFRKMYLSPLRSYLNIVEKLMCNQSWSSIDYNRVPSCAMRRLKKAFARHDLGRFDEWKKALAAGVPNAKVNAKVLYPHELVSEYLNGKLYDQVVESQWQVLMDETKKYGDLGRSLVISDVSGSMYGTPLEVSVALGIMIGQLCSEPFRGNLITFSRYPQFHTIRGKSLYDQVTDVKRMNWDMNTDFIAVFRLILSKSKQYRILPENMPNRLYVLSDMQFDQASAGNYQTNYETIKCMYHQCGYELPEIVFWNLQGNTLDFPIGDATQLGVALVSGFSPSILKALINGRELSPVTVLREAIDDRRYDSIKRYCD